MRDKQTTLSAPEHNSFKSPRLLLDIKAVNHPVSNQTCCTVVCFPRSGIIFDKIDISNDRDLKPVVEMINS